MLKPHQFCCFTTKNSRYGSPNCPQRTLHAFCSVISTPRSANCRKYFHRSAVNLKKLRTLRSKHLIYSAVPNINVLSPGILSSMKNTLSVTMHVTGGFRVDGSTLY